MTKMPLLFLLLLLVNLSSAEIRTVKINSDGRPMILFERFGFTHSGHATISVSAISTVGSSPDSSLLGFFLLSEESLTQVVVELQSNPYFCVLDSNYIILLFNFRDLSPPPASSFNLSYPVTSPNEYSLFFANCAPELTVSMDVRTELYNLVGQDKDYLPAGLTQLPFLYLFFSFLYFAFFAFWAYECSKSVKAVRRIHLLMGALVIVKAMNLLFAAEYYHSVKVTGTPHGWDVLFYLFQFIRVVVWFTVIILIGTGWSFPKPFLQEKGKKVLMIVIPLQVLANVASIVIGKTGPFIRDWVAWNQVFLLVDIICCCAIIFLMVWSIRSLREMSKIDRNLAKLTLFRQFYIVVMGYLFLTRIVVFALTAVAAYKHQWEANAAEEIASLAFYAVIFYMFRPVEEEEDAAEEALKDEKFDS